MTTTPIARAATNRELIERLAREAGFVDYELDDGTTEAFDKRYARLAALVAEECAKDCEAHSGLRSTGAWVALTAEADRIRAKFPPC